MNALFSHKNFRRHLILVLLVLSVVLGYVYFLTAVKRDRYQLFNTKKTVTWVQSDRNVYRTHVHGSVDSMLLSEDHWRSYVLSLRLTNADDCGLIFDYTDPLNYSFYFFKKSFKQIISGQLKDGKLQGIKQATYEVPASFTLALKKQSGSVQLIVDGLPMPDVPASAVPGKVGLIINSMAKPPTVFQNISIDGSLANGQKIVHEVAPQSNSGVVKALGNFLPFYVVFIFALLFAPRFFSVFSTQSLAHSPVFQKFFPAGLHIFLAACFFWPFIRAGEVAVFSYDNLGEIYPLFYYAKHNFINIVQGHAPWLWNPLVHNGFPFYSNHWDMIYYPLNWPTFLVPDQYFLTALTFKSLVEVALIGILAYGFFVREFGNRRWALFSSVAYQMCSLLIFTMSIAPATSLYFAMTVYLYVLWSAPERKVLTNFLLLSFAVVLILTSANVAFIFYACLALGIVSIYRFRTVQDGKSLFLVAAAGWLTGALIASVRILSCLYGVANSNRLLENFHTIHDRAYMALRLFVPEITGWMGPDAHNVLMSPNLRLIFRDLDLPSNPQNSFFIYFGVIPALLLFASLLMPAKGKHAFWRIYAFVALGIALLWQPLWGILSILSFPLNHYSYHAVILPVGICALIGYTGMAWEAGDSGHKNFQRNLVLGVLFVFAYLLVFVTYLFPDLTPVTRIIFLVMGTGAVLYFLKLFPSVITVLNVVPLTLLIVLSLLYVLAPIPKKEGFGTAFLLPFLWLAAAVSLTLWGHHRNREGRDFKTVLLSLIFALVASAGIVFVGLVDGVLNLQQGVRIYTLDVLSGFVRLFLLIQVAILALSGLHKKIFSLRVVFVVLLSLTAMDLVVFNARFNNITAPFYFKNAFYPKEFAYRDLAPDLKQRMDLVNYRVNHIDRKDFNANKNLVFNIPGYTGTVGYMTPRFSKLLTAFGYPQGIYMLYPEDSTDNPRFLDLSAVRYVFDEKGDLVERSTSLARLNVVHSAEIIADDDETLERLRSDIFEPRKTVLLSQSLAVSLASSGPESISVPITHNTPNRIEAKVSVATPAVLLFAESYDEGWKAFIGSKRVPIVRANYNFMACSVGPGEHIVRFVYDPAPYKRHLWLSLLGLFVFIFALAAALFKIRMKK